MSSVITRGICLDARQFISRRPKVPLLFTVFLIFLYFLNSPAAFANEYPHFTDLQAGFTLTPLNDITITSNITGEKPQSKVWRHDGKWWAVLPNSSGTHIWRLDGTTWNSILQISNVTNYKADCKVAGEVVHILLVRQGITPAHLISVEYLPASQTYQLWSVRPTTVDINVSSSIETATIDIDSQGRMWLASDANTTIEVRYSDSPYSTWDGPLTLAANVSADVDADDICVVTAFDGKIGVLWSDQVLEEFGFKWHQDGADPASWSSKETPPNPFGTTGMGFSDDHLNVAVASDGAIYAAVKTGFDNPPDYPTIVLLRRLPAGTWNSYWVDDDGTRGIVVLNEAQGIVSVAYTEFTGGGSIVYRQSLTSSISFGPQLTLISGNYNDVTSAKDNFSDEIVFFASAGATGSSVLASASPPEVDLRGHWAMEEGSGTTLVDSSIYGNNAATAGNPTWTTGVKGSALNLNGTTQYAIVPDDPSLDITDAITLAAWIKPAKSVSATQYIIKKAIMGSTDGYELSLSLDGKVFVRFNQVTSLNTYRLDSQTSYPLNSSDWMHIAATYDGSNIRLYINGVEESTSPLAASFTIATNANNLGIGAQPDAGAASKFQGLLDDLRVYSRALSGAEIAALATIPSPPTPTFSTDGSGRALDFDGNNDFVNCGNGASVNITNQITLEAWIRPGAIATQYLIKKGRISLNDGYEISLSASTSPSPPSKVFARFNQSTSGNTYRVNSVTTYPTNGAWIHVAVTYDGSIIRLYYNGVEEASLSAAITIGSNSDPLTLGAEGDGSDNFNGMMDEVRVWNVARSEQQIRQYMCQKLAGTESGLVGYWRFDEDFGVIAIDETSNGNDGTLTNMAENDHAWSGAALGDESNYDYDSNGGFTASLSHTDGDNLIAATTAGTINGIHVYRADANALRNDATLPMSLVNISPLRFWGVFVAGSGGPQYTVTYTYAGHPGIVDENDLALAVRDDHSDNSWADVVADLNTAANTLIKTGQGGTEYALASVTPDNSLPVELSAFTAAPGDERISLKWTTESETNNLGFILERALSEEGPFAEIASYEYVPELRGQGNSSQQVNYEYADKKLQNGITCYYRLSDVDLNGNRAYYSAIVSATPHELITRFYLHPNYPNPFNPGTTIRLEVPENADRERKIDLTIYNSLGQAVRKLYSGAVEGGIHEFYWDGKDGRNQAVASGIYFLQMKAPDYSKTISMVLRR